MNLFIFLNIDCKGGFVWGGYTNGGAVLVKDRLLSVGRFFGEPGNPVPILNI